MPNPGGNYPGRQIAMGAIEGKPAFAYFVSGRSEKSQKRYATPFLYPEHAIRINPLDMNEKFDQFRHYQAVRIDPETGLLLVSNSQAPNDAIFEAYKFKNMTKEDPFFRAAIILSSIGPEYDNKQKPTARVLGICDPSDIEDGEFDMFLQTKRPYGHQIGFGMNTIADGRMHFVQTYDGNVDYGDFDYTMFVDHKSAFDTSAKTPQDLAEEIYGSSDYIDPTYGVLRVSCIAGVRNGNGPGGWEIAIKNRYRVD